MIKKITTLLLAIAMVFTIQLSQPKQAYALDLDDPSNIANQIWQFTKDDVLKPVVKSLADRVLTKLTSDTINWANNGFDGDPGFVNNWEYFLKGTEHEVISNAFNTASNVANNIQLNSDIDNLTCINEVYAQYPLAENSEAACANRYDQYLNEFEGCIYQLDPLEDEELIEACENERDAQEIAWDTCIDQIPLYNSALQACQDNTSQLASNVAAIAEQNYQLYQSGELNTKRAVATTIATAGSERLNIDPLDSLIQGQGETLTELLGSQGAKDAFKTDITVGGWEGYLALADPHNYDAGLQTLVKGALGQKTTSKVSSVVQDLQTPVKVLDKKICSDGSSINDGSCPEGTQIITATPGGQVEAKLNNALISEEDKGKFFSDSLVTPLISSLGRLTDGLLESGLSQLTGAAVNTFFTPQESQNTFATTGVTDYQSQYDVLGITSNPSTTTIANATGSSSSSTSTIFGNTVDTSFIGGPEDIGNTAWSNSPQVIINLRQELTRNIHLAEEELGYYNEASDILDGSQNTAIELDRCLPGPDYNWEQRYKDVFDVNGNESDQIGLTETKEMVEDPLVNIPGSERIRSLFSQLLGGTRTERIQIDQRITTLNNLLLNLKFIRQNIQDEFDAYKNELNVSELVLNESQWDELSSTQKLQAAEHAANGFEKFDGSSSITYLNLRIEEGETTSSVLTNNPNRVRDAVITMAWDIWRDRTPRDTKEEYRYGFYIEQSNLSNNEFIARAKANRNRIDSGAVESEKILSDCLVLKSYALGANLSELQSIVSGSDTNTTATEQTIVNTALFNLNPYLAIGNIFGLFGGGGGGFTFIGVPTPYRTNEDIRIFLEDEYAKINDGDPNTESVFTSNVIASPTAIENSVLRFDDSIIETVSVQVTPGTETTLPEYEDQEFPQTEAYFQRYYPDYGFKPIQQNTYEIKDMFLKDRFFSSFNRARGERGVLFCRNPRISDLQRSTGLGGDDDSDFQPECIRHNWYAASNLDYQLIFSGVINTGI